MALHQGAASVSGPRPRMVGINHVALEVADLEAAVTFYEDLFEIQSIDREDGMAFLAMGDQFLALSEAPDVAPQRGRHFGLVVDDKEGVRAALIRAGVAISQGRRLNFRDPWGNHLQIVDYRDVQFTKAPSILRAMGVSAEKNPAALAELKANGLL
jgi:catechol 2,3-dioxygenase-like lactoylglutathione lyase family enzyme